MWKCKILRKTIMPKFGTKNVLLGIYDQECLIWVFLGYKFKKLLWHLRSAPWNLSNCKILWKTKNAQIWDQKYLIWVFLGWNFKKLLSCLKSAPSNLSNCKILHKKKKKLPKFGTKNALFGHFRVRILKKLLSYLKSAPSNLSNCKTSWKKNAEIWDQNTLSGIFDQECLIWVF